MKKRNGFTLIELLAVVVILAVIALISTPLIMNVIDGAQKGAFQNTAYGILEAAKYTYTNEVIKDGKADFTVYKYAGGIETSVPADKTLSYKGSAPKSGTIFVNSKGEVALAIYNGKYCVQKDYDDLEVTVNPTTEANCVIEATLTEVEVLVVAGGGPGGSNYAEDGTGTAGGGGGAGGLIYKDNYAVTPGTSINVTVGDGGKTSMVIGAGQQGGNSTFGTLTAIGGGSGASRGAAPTNGGSGGGGGYFKNPGGLGVIGQGFNGGGNGGQLYGGSGGGGAKEIGIASIGDSGAIGGAGLYFGDKFGDNFGDSGYFAGGGGGGGRVGATGGNGGTGGGGKGGAGSHGTNGISNTGGGGGGSSSYTYYGGNGGSGIVLVRYPGPQRATGGTVTTYDDYTIHAFTSGSGTFEPIAY